MLKIAFKGFTNDAAEFYDPKVWKFPCGEVGVQLTTEILANLASPKLTEVGIKVEFSSNDDLFALAQLVDAIRAVNLDVAISAWIPYFPYARQDRRANLGEGHALKIACQFINQLNFKYVCVDDAHSTVLEALLDRLAPYPQEKCARELPKFDVLLAPDAGAEKKIFKHNQVALGTEVICASKVRSPEGKITKTVLPYGGRLTGKTVCIVDDLCDGGATFLELGRVAREFEPAELCLYVTHGMFTNPEKFVELNDLFDRIFVYNLRPEAKKQFSQYVEQI
jgi:ribose-phosphate pyrophosphokinase